MFTEAIYVQLLAQTAAAKGSTQECGFPQNGFGLRTVRIGSTIISKTKNRSGKNPACGDHGEIPARGSPGTGGATTLTPAAAILIMIPHTASPSVACAIGGLAMVRIKTTTPMEMPSLTIQVAL